MERYMSSGKHFRPPEKEKKIIQQLFSSMGSWVFLDALRKEMTTLHISSFPLTPSHILPFGLGRIKKKKEKNCHSGCSLWIFNFLPDISACFQILCSLNSDLKEVYDNIWSLTGSLSSNKLQYITVQPSWQYSVKCCVHHERTVGGFLV